MDNIEIGDKSFESVLDQLEVTVIALYEALLFYQIISVCYYRNRSSPFSADSAASAIVVLLPYSALHGIASFILRYGACSQEYSVI